MNGHCVRHCLRGTTCAQVAISQALQLVAGATISWCADVPFVEFYLYPTVSTALVHSVKPKLTEQDEIEFDERSNWVVYGMYGIH